MGMGHFARSPLRRASGGTRWLFYLTRSIQWRSRRSIRQGALRILAFRETGRYWIHWPSMVAKDYLAEERHHRHPACAPHRALPRPLDRLPRVAMEEDEGPPSNAVSTRETPGSGESASILVLSCAITAFTLLVVPWGEIQDPAGLGAGGVEIYSRLRKLKEASDRLPHQQHMHAWIDWVVVVGVAVPNPGVTRYEFPLRLRGSGRKFRVLISRRAFFLVGDSARRCGGSVLVFLEWRWPAVVTQRAPFAPGEKWWVRCRAAIRNWP